MTGREEAKQANPLLAWTAFSDRTPCCEPEALLRTEKLSLAYGQHVAFRDVTLPINRGCITAIVGPSGCGKSSFLQSLNRLTDLIPQARISGEIFFNDQAIHNPAMDVVGLRRKVGMIFKNRILFLFPFAKT